ncbi:MAG: hypothetical protein PHT94_03950 [Candidatus Nanoarchaeia archaeon]|nr:hypothetical protein [Candidatus Nanoarchaeia archaeon]
MDKNKFNYFIIFFVLFFLGIVIYNNFYSSNSNQLSNLDLFFMNLFPLVSIVKLKILNILFFVLCLFILSRIINEKWHIFTLVLILNPLVYYILVSVNLLFFELFIVLFSIYLVKTNKKFSFFVFVLLILLFKMDSFLYIVLTLSIYLLNKNFVGVNLKIIKEENKELILTIIAIISMYIINMRSKYLQFNYLSDVNLSMTLVVFSLVYLIFGAIGLFHLNRLKKINLFQIILLIILGFFFREEIFISLMINFVLVYFITNYFIVFIFKKWKFLELKNITMILLMILFVSNIFMINIQKQEYQDYSFECGFDDYILTDIHNYEFVKNNNNGCQIKIFEEDFSLNQKKYMDKLDYETFYKNRIDISNTTLLTSNSVSKSNDNEYILNQRNDSFSNNNDNNNNFSNEDLKNISSEENIINKYQKDLMNLEVVDFLVNMFLSPNRTKIDPLKNQATITIYEELFYELDIINFLNKAIINNVKYIMLSKDSFNKIWDYNFGLISYYKRFKYVEDSNYIIIKIYS